MFRWKRKNILLRSCFRIDNHMPSIIHLQNFDYYRPVTMQKAEWGTKNGERVSHSVSYCASATIRYKK
jgi:hypothetical protein